MASSKVPIERGNAAVTPSKGTTRSRLVPVAMIGAGIVLLFVAAFAFGFVSFGSGSRELTGAIVNPPFAAPDFQLSDQFGQPVRLSSFKGKVVVLTFLYTNCPDACPLITGKLHQ